MNQLHSNSLKYCLIGFQHPATPFELPGPVAFPITQAGPKLIPSWLRSHGPTDLSPKQQRRSLVIQGRPTSLFPQVLRCRFFEILRNPIHINSHVASGHDSGSQSMPEAPSRQCWASSCQNLPSLQVAMSVRWWYSEIFELIPWLTNWLKPLQEKIGLRSMYDYVWYEYKAC